MVHWNYASYLSGGKPCSFVILAVKFWVVEIIESFKATRLLLDVLYFTRIFGFSFSWFSIESPKLVFFDVVL